METTNKGLFREDSKTIWRKLSDWLNPVYFVVEPDDGPVSFGKKMTCKRCASKTPMTSLQKNEFLLCEECGWVACPNCAWFNHLAGEEDGLTSEKVQEYLSGVEQKCKKKPRTSCTT